MNLRDSTPAQLSHRNGGELADPIQDPSYFLPKLEAGRFLSFVLRRGWLVVLLGALGVACSMIYLKDAKKIYRSQGSVYVGTQAPQVLNIQAVSQEESKDLEQMRSVEQGLLSTTVLLRLIEEYRLAEDPSFAAPGTGQELLVRTLAQRVRVELRRGTRLIDVFVDDTDPDRARELVQAIVAQYEKSSTERQQAIIQQASDGLAREERRLREKMGASSLKLQEFREGHKIPGLEVKEGNSLPDDNVTTLTTQLSQAKSERLRLEAEYESFRKFDPRDPGALAGVGNSEQVAEVASQVRMIQAKEAEFAAIKERYLEKHPTYISIASELVRLRKNLEDSSTAAGNALEKKYRIATENETKLQDALVAAQGQAVEVEGLREQFRNLDREAEADRSLHDAVAGRLRETALSAAVPTSVLRWEDSPMTPEKPHSPRKLVALALGGSGGMFLGLLLMLGLELADGKVRDAAAAARATGVPLLVRISSGNTGDAFRQLRTLLSPDDGAGSARTVIFAGAGKGDGRSFCALNYATSLALQGHRTLLLDADLRSPGLSSEQMGRRGLGDFLAGEVAPSEACFATSQKNLYLLSSGTPREDSGDLLSGTRFAALLADAYRWFDRVVIDTPPLSDSGDAALISRYADRCCLVVSDRGSDRRSLQRASELVRTAGGSLVGFVWNEVPRGGRDRKAPPVAPLPADALIAAASSGSPRDTVYFHRGLAS